MHYMLLPFLNNTNLFPGALDGEKPSGDAETETKVEEPVEEDMEISDTDENGGKPPLPPMPPPDDDQPFKEQAWRQNGELFVDHHLYLLARAIAL